MSDGFYGSLMAIVYGTAVATMIAGWCGAFNLTPPPAPPAPIVAPAPEGPRCTLAYPRGFKFTKREKKLASCGKLDVDGVVWGLCSRRVPT
jgi:hypothetical protein